MSSNIRCNENRQAFVMKTANNCNRYYHWNWLVCQYQRHHEQCIVEHNAERLHCFIHLCDTRTAQFSLREGRLTLPITFCIFFVFFLVHIYATPCGMFSTFTSYRAKRSFAGGIARHFFREGRGSTIFCIRWRGVSVCTCIHTQENKKIRKSLKPPSPETLMSFASYAGCRFAATVHWCML